MPRLGLGLGLNLPRPIFIGGGGSPTVPTGALAIYTAYSPSNFTLVTGDSVNVWQDESVNSNDLTQGTSGNQPVLVEDNTVTQFTASNQPTFAKDKQVTQDTLANMPTYDSVAGALDFSGGKVLDGLTPIIGNKLFHFVIDYDNATGTTQFLVRYNSGGQSSVRCSTANTINVRTDNNVSNTFPTGTLSSGLNDIKIWFNGNTVSLYLGDVFQSTVDITGTSFELYEALGNTVSSFEGSFYSATFYGDVADPLNITETPDEVLDGSDPTTMLNDSDVQPVNGDSVRLWHDPSAVDVVAFNRTSLENLPTSAGDTVTKLDIFGIEDTSKYLTSSTTLAQFFNNNNSFISLISDDGAIFTSALSEGVQNRRLELGYEIEGNSLRILDNNIVIGTHDITGETFTGLDLISFNSGATDFNLYSFKKWNSSDSSGEPDFTLTPDPTKMRTSANANPVLGEDVAKWYADEFSAYRDSRVVFDATNDNMSGLPALTGDWSYMIDTSINTLATTKYLLEQTAGSSAILALADNYMYLRDTTGVNDIALTSYTLTTSRTQFGFVRSGDDLLYYVNGVLKETVDVTGRTFDFGTVGKSATSADMDTKQIIPFDRALTVNELAYYSYLRSETGEILLPPLLPS